MERPYLINKIEEQWKAYTCVHHTKTCIFTCMPHTETHNKREKKKIVSPEFDFSIL